ncbi:hypothetical protein FHX06_005676 [Rhizobium sp. BK512]|nr:hypothetical protein [Rhizobium sp. BK512]
MTGDHLVRLVFEGEMSGVEEMRFGAGQVAKEGVSAF